MVYLKWTLITLISYFLSVCSCCHFEPEHDQIKDICPEDQPGHIEKSDCYKWCRNASSWSYDLIDPDRGVIRISLRPSPLHCNHNEIGIILLVVEGTPCSLITSDLAADNSNKHTEQRILLNRIPAENSSSCSQIVLEFDYIFTGCYQMILNPYEGSNSRRSCRTQLFDVETNYVKKPILVPTVSSMNVQAGILFRALWEVESPFWIEKIQLCLDLLQEHNLGQTENLFKEANCTLDTSKNSLDKIGEDVEIPRKNYNCNCEWINSYSNITLKCTFINIQDGDYRIYIQGYDTRCIPYTLWTEHIIPCSWHHDHTFLKENVTVEVTVKPPQSAVILHWLTLAFLIFLGVLNITAVYIFYSRCYRQRKSPLNHVISSSYDNLSIEIDKLLSKKTRVLLLYPRDCSQFMEAMDAFRQLLASINHFQVIDPHDSELYEEVVSHLDTWGSQYILDESTKVILVASECSLMLEEAFIKNDRLSFRDKLPIDNVFILLLYRLFSLNNDLSYKKVFVVRLDSGEIEKLHFQVQFQCRNFTIPQSTDVLIHMLLGLPVEKPLKVDDPDDKLMKLEKAIITYSDYLSKNPCYINNILIREDESQPGA